MDSRPGHDFQAPTASDSRSPCPALNSAANHGYLPRNGKNITIFQLIGALHEVYNLTYPLACTLSMGIFMCGNIYTFDLASLDQHNRIEHDASLIRMDSREGDWVHPNQQLLDAMIAESSNGQSLTLDDFARVRAKRELRLPGGKLDKLHSVIAGGETVLVVKVVGDGNEVPIETIKQWFGEERLPRGWMPNGNMPLLELVKMNRQFVKMIEQAKEELRSQ